MYAIVLLILHFGAYPLVFLALRDSSDGQDAAGKAWAPFMTTGSALLLFVTPTAVLLSILAHRNRNRLSPLMLRLCRVPLVMTVAMGILLLLLLVGW